MTRMIKDQPGPASPLQVWLIEMIKEKAVPQRRLAEVAELSEKHVSQMMTGKTEGSLSAWSRLLIAAEALTIADTDIEEDPVTDSLPPLVTMQVNTRHPEDYLLVNRRDNTRWVIVGGLWAPEEDQ